MQIAVVLNAHNNPDLVRDTLDSIRTYVSEHIVLVIDGVGWPYFKDFEYPGTEIVQGVSHGVSRSPYKNVAIGLQIAAALYPDADWYCYTEFDILFTSSGFKDDLEQGADASLLSLECKTKLKSDDHWIVKEILGPGLSCRKSLGALNFYSGRTIRGLMRRDFFKLLLDKTCGFSKAAFPNFKEYAVEEIVFPTAASAFGPIVDLRSFGGEKSKYLVRFRPTVEMHELSPETCACHPLKQLDDPVRVHFRTIRNKEK